MSYSAVLPYNVSWDDFKTQPLDYQSEIPLLKQNIGHAKWEDVMFYLPIFLSFIIFLRLFIQNYVFHYIGIHYFQLLTTKHKERKLSKTDYSHSNWEQHFEHVLHTSTKSKQSDHRTSILRQKTIDAIVNSTDGDSSRRNIENWVRVRINTFIGEEKDRKARLAEQKNLEKFTESGWRFFAYTCIYTFGTSTLLSKPWFWNVIYCWTEYPSLISFDVWCYYMLELALYVSFLVFQFFEAGKSRSDFWPLFIHHITTFLLIYISFAMNLVRVGTLIMWVHDIADIVLESAKMFKYSGKYGNISDMLFLLFVIVWLMTRVTYFPIIVLHSIAFEALHFFSPNKMYFAFVILLFCLLVLNIFWLYLVFKSTIRAVLNTHSDSNGGQAGKMEDVRSDEDDIDNNDTIIVDDQ